MPPDSQPPVWEQQIVDFLREPVPERIMERGVLVIADVLAAGVAGASIEDIQQVGANAEFPAGSASVLGVDRTLAPGHAALVNTAAAIAQEIEEGHNTGGHVGASIVVGGFAAAEHADVDGETFVEAVVKAYEVCVRLERAIFAMKDRMNETLPWLIRDPHSTWTTVGPALASAFCLGLDATAMRETMRIAANLAVVSMHDPYEEGAPARNYTAGISAQAGVNATLIAATSLHGSVAALHEVYNPLIEMTDGDFEQWFAALGDDWEIRENYFKFTPSCRYTHPPLGALEEIRDDVDPDRIERIDVYTFRNACDLAYSDVSNYMSAKFSVPYVLARALVAEDLWFDDFEETALADDETEALAETVQLHHDPKYERSFPDHWSARLEVTHDDGRRVSAECIDPPGDYRHTPSDASLKEIFTDCFAWTLGDDAAADALDATLSIRERDCRAVGRTLRP